MLYVSAIRQLQNKNCHGPRKRATKLLPYRLGRAFSLEFDTRLPGHLRGAAPFARKRARNLRGPVAVAPAPGDDNYFLRTQVRHVG